jgi:hypothetical protein
MPRNIISKDDIKLLIMKEKANLRLEDVTYSSDPKSLANMYLNKLLDKIEEYRL